MTENIYEPTEYNYDPYDLCECYEPIVEPPESFIEECEIYWSNISKIMRRVSQQKIGHTTYIVTTKFSGTEKILDKVKRMIFDDNEEVSG
ncbi:MAG: transposon-encoded TnpW family protein [Clostridia bacterium]|nr:transposon-encoded TnpW family protein [Clostridia bacterium]